MWIPRFTGEALDFFVRAVGLIYADEKSLTTVKSRPVARLDTPCYILFPDQNRVVAKLLDGLEYHCRREERWGR